MINVTVNKKGTVKAISFKLFDYLLNKGKLAAITLYTGDAISDTEWFVKSVIQ